MGLVGCGGVTVEEWSCEDVPWDGIDIGESFPVIAFCTQDGCGPDSGTMTNGETGWESSNCDWAGPNAYLMAGLIPWTPEEQRLDTESIPADDGFPLLSYCIEYTDGLRCSYVVAHTDSEGNALPAVSGSLDGYLLFQWWKRGRPTVIGADEARAGIAAEGEVPLIRVCKEDACSQDWNWRIEEGTLYAAGDPDQNGRVEILWLK